MANGNAIAHNVAVFISTLFLLEFGAGKFVDHTAIVARRTGIPGSVIALLTAGAESSKIYSLCLLVITTFVAPIIYFSQRVVWLICVSILIALFAIYLISIGWDIRRGSLTVPKNSDDDSSDDESDTLSIRSTPSVRSPLLPSHEGREPEERNESDQLIDRGPEAAVVTDVSRRRRRRSLGYHVGFLVLDFLAICLSGYVLSHAAINITDAIGISDIVFGVVILAIASTLPEKFIVVLSGNRGHVGILVANTVGSNVFLLSLCLGISGNFEGGNASLSELYVLWGSTLALTITVCTPATTTNMLMDPRDLVEMNLSAGLSGLDQTSSLEPNTDQNMNLSSQTGSAGSGNGGRSRRNNTRGIWASQPVDGSGNDEAYSPRNGNPRDPHDQGGRSRFHEKPRTLYFTAEPPNTCQLCPPTSLVETDISGHQDLCKHQQHRAQQGRY
ncbi:hypothetical protein LB506_004637 [Fusarium annulatum]|nr:hypothetical protein LB506_004637 [Fusarium annulatum]